LLSKADVIFFFFLDFSASPGLRANFDFAATLACLGTILFFFHSQTGTEHTKKEKTQISSHLHLFASVEIYVTSSAIV